MSMIRVGTVFAILFSVAHSAAGDDVETLFARMRESREQLRSYRVKVTSTEENWPKGVVLTGDFPVGKFRFDQEGDEFKSLIVLPDRMIRPGGIRFEHEAIAVEERDPDLFWDVRPMLDPRAIGMNGGNRDPDSLANIWKGATESDHRRILERDGDLTIVAVQQAFETLKGERGSPIVSCFTVDESRGYVPVLVRSYFGKTVAQFAAETAEKRSKPNFEVETEWEQKGEVWVPVSSKETSFSSLRTDGTTGVRSDTVRFEWESVNAELDPGLFEYRSLYSGEGEVYVYDFRTLPAKLIEVLGKP